MNGLRDIAERIVRDAMPATDSGHTCFVPRYQVDELAAAIASTPAADGEVGKVVGYANRNEFAMDGCAGFMCSKRPPLTDASFFTIPLYTTPQPPSPPTDSGERGDGLPEPVVIVGKVWSLVWAGGDAISTIADRYGLKVGDGLYAKSQFAAYAQQCRSADQATIARLTAEVEAARVDAERLDWLDRQRGDDVRQVGHDDYVLVAHYWSVQGQCMDVRSAIDDIAGAAKLTMPSVDQETGSVTGREP